MFKRLQTASLSLAEVLSGTSEFNIPYFQRQYSWTIHNAESLLEDLIEASGALDPDAAQPDYFLGPVLLLDPSVDESGDLGSEMSSGGDRQRGIIDGQQRFLTLTTLAAVLRDLDANSESELVHMLDALVWHQVTGSKNDSADTANPRIDVNSSFSGFFQKYVQAKHACTKAADPTEENSVDKEILLGVRNRFWHELKDLEQGERDRLARYLCEKCHFLVASTDDQARAHLIFTRMNERGKSLESFDLLKSDVIGEVASSETEFVDQSWRDVQERLGEDFGALFSHLRVIHDTTRGPMLPAIRAIKYKVGGGVSFVRQELAPYAEVFQQIRLGQVDEGELPQRIRAYLVSLGRLNGEEWLPATLLALKPGLYSSEEAETLIRMIERYAYLLRMLMLAVNKRRRRFAAIAGAVRDGSALTDLDNTFPLSREENRTIIFNLRELYGRNQNNCKAVLMRLNDHFSEKSVVLTPSKYSVEHVLPRRIGANSEWREWHRDAEQRGVLTHSLGNLALVTGNQNAQLGNKEFGQKIEVLRKAEEQTGLQPITRDILQVSEWKSGEILAREARMLEAIEEVWQISSKVNKKN
ncbi:MAG: DUF262 domain-containing protein [Hyphomicrobiaceae bacterium]